MTTITTNEQAVMAPDGMWSRFRWNVRRSMIVTRREVVDMLRDWRILAPIIVLTVIFPTIANWGAGRMIGWVAQYGADIVGERLIPFLMMVVGFFPISFSLIIALESFVGEKERFSLEPLLSTPLTNLQLYIGKTLSSTLPPVIGSVLGITVYLVGVYFNVGYRPPLLLLVQVLLLTVMQALVMVSGAVVVSSQATSVRAANLLASFIIIPVAFLIQLEAIIMFWARYNTLWYILLALLLINLVLIRMGVQIFNREQLLGREIDDLNLYKTIQDWFHMTLARHENGQRSVWQWYRDEVIRPLWGLRYPILIALGVVVAAYMIGQDYAFKYSFPENLFVEDNWYEEFSNILTQIGFVGIPGVLKVLFQNVRTLLLATVLGMFTFGIASMLILMLPTGLIGYILPQMTNAGLSSSVLWAALLPHGVIEMIAAIIAGAAALRLGASVIAPPPGKTLGEGWLMALSDITRLWLCLILPMLVIAAIIEVFVTPSVVLLVGAG